MPLARAKTIVLQVFILSAGLAADVVCYMLVFLLVVLAPN